MRIRPKVAMCTSQGVGSARDIFRGSGFILQMDHDIYLTIFQML